MSKRKDEDGIVLRFEEFELTPPTEEQQRRAVRFVCSSAPDATVALELLDMLGLQP